MKLLTTTQIKDWDRYTIEHEPIPSIDLMERAAQALAAAILRRWGEEMPVTLFAGPGNNGGDALAVARILTEKGCRTHTYLFNIKGKLSADCAANKERLAVCNGAALTEVTSRFDPPVLSETDLIVDGLFGSGLNKPLSGGFASVVSYINASPATVVAIDIPSGMMGEDNSYNLRKHIVRADVTLTLQQPKLSFLFAENQELTGEVEILDIGLHPGALQEIPARYAITEEEEMRRLIRPRNRFAHKGNFGHDLLIAGRYGMAGASILAARACMRSGAGLLTVRIPRLNNDILQTCVPEAILQHDESADHLSGLSSGEDYDAIAIGPGIGTHLETAYAMIEEARRAQVPVILDADALNILAEHPEWMDQLPPHTILTPHPKELERLIGRCRDSYERLTRAQELAARQRLYLIVKGAWTAVVTPDGAVYFNPTGNPGMATAGSGDVLTGILLSLAGQGYTPEETCRLGVYVHGLAGDIAAGRRGETAMTAGDIIDCLPDAWMKLN